MSASSLDNTVSPDDASSLLRASSLEKTVLVRQLGQVDYVPCCTRMTEFTASRDDQTTDELWLLQHPRVFTQGQAGKAEHVLMPGDIPVVQADRGGQVTYHGPGQLVVYVMVDIARKGLGSRALVSAIERALVDTLAVWGIEAFARDDAPGVYVDERKIASLGLRIKKGRSFHGLALNVDMDLAPFARINPCGYAGMQMTQMISETRLPVSVSEVGQSLITHLAEQLDFSEIRRA